MIMEMNILCAMFRPPIFLQPGLIVTLFTLVGWIVPPAVIGGWIWLYNQRKLLAKAKKQITRLESHSQKTKAEIAALRSQLGQATSALHETLEKPTGASESCLGISINSRDLKAANECVIQWLQEQGPAISSLLLLRAEWLAANAAGSQRNLGLLGARDFCTAALTMNPRNEAARGLRAELQSLLTGSKLALLQEVESVDLQYHNLYASMTEVVEEELKKECEKRLESGHLQAAYCSARHAMSRGDDRWNRDCGLTLRVQRLLCLTLMRMQRWEEALFVKNGIVDELVSRPEFGPTHHETFGEYLSLAQILRQIGKKDESLSISRNISKALKCIENDNVGSTYCDLTYQAAQLLYTLGECEEALPLAMCVYQSRRRSVLGAIQQSTILSGQLVALILYSLGRGDEALGIIQDSYDASLLCTELGPGHPGTMACYQLLALIMESVSRHEDALFVLEDLVRESSLHPELGVYHPETLNRQFLLARVLHSLSRDNEALALATEVQVLQSSSQDLGPSHPHTLATKSLRGQILNKMGQNDHALEVILGVLQIREAAGSKGREPASIMKDREILSNILCDLGLGKEVRSLVWNMEHRNWNLFS